MTFSQQAHAPPTADSAVGGASERSERGRSALFKNPLFFHVNSLRRDNFCPRLGTKKSPCCIGSKKLSSEAIFTKFSAYESV